LERIALLETSAGQKFFFAPVGVDEGWTVSEKVSFVEDGRRLARAFGLPDKAVILSGGRLGDIGRHEMVDRTIYEAEEAAEISGAVHGEILIEDAVSDAGVIIAPDGISGNLIFRTLVFLGGGIGHGALIVNIKDLFIDSSRASSSYEGILSMAKCIIDGQIH
ncbi:MAG TPA: phosphotransacetylase, partial [Methanocorpusculum sp.]|nr:phosphotransacetylase [Methanocorpusculum sp.]